MIDLLFQLRQILGNRLPEDFQIHVKIGVNDDVAHVAHLPPRKLRMLRDEVRGHMINLGRGLADDLDVADNPILNQRVLPECFKALQRLNVAGRARNGFGNMGSPDDLFKIVR
jgi:hypothetical protein